VPVLAQVQRKQHIGNDVVVIIFVDGRTPFSPISFTSQFNSYSSPTFPSGLCLTPTPCWRGNTTAEVFVVVQKDESSKGDITRYRVAVTASKPVPFHTFHPILPRAASHGGGGGGGGGWDEGSFIWPTAVWDDIVCERA